MVANPLERSVEFRNDKAKRAVFDHVLGPSASQAFVFRTIAAPIVDDVFRGINGCIIAYGQTGAGKTFSLMELTPGRLGLLPRAIHELFDRLQQHDREGSESVVQLRYLQIYMEQVFDLLEHTGACGCMICTHIN